MMVLRSNTTGMTTMNTDNYIAIFKSAHNVRVNDGELLEQCF